MREKPPGVLTPEEEANSDSPKAFLPANLLPVPDCCHIGVPTAGEFTSPFDLFCCFIMRQMRGGQSPEGIVKQREQQTEMSLKSS